MRKFYGRNFIAMLLDSTVEVYTNIMNSVTEDL